MPTSLAVNPLIDPVPGLMIWTIVCFAITFFVLRKYAFGPIQKIIDERRDRIRKALDEADKAREEARRAARGAPALPGAGAKARRRRSSPRRAASPTRCASGRREETEEDRQRRLEETKREIEAETVRALEQIRSEVAEPGARRGRAGHAARCSTQEDQRG